MKSKDPDDEVSGLSLLSFIRKASLAEAYKTESLELTRSCLFSSLPRCAAAISGILCSNTSFKALWPPLKKRNKDNTKA